jgi:hypothetical protein
VLRTRLKHLAAQRRRFGYRRLHLLIARSAHICAVVRTSHAAVPATIRAYS